MVLGVDRLSIVGVHHHIVNDRGDEREQEYRRDLCP